MYAPFFGLKHEPFSIAPDPRYLYMSERHREALAHLLYGLGSGGGFVLLTGEIGAGKTTVCRCFLEQIPKRCNVAYIFNPKLTVEELLRTICDEFHVPYRHIGEGAPTVKDYVDPLNEYLLKTHAVGQNNILIVDEAQNLSIDVLEQLRLLTNLETNERKLLQIVLIGQPELRGLLASPKLEQLAQRVVARYHLGALSPEETVHYVRHRLGVAGLTAALPFEPAALDRIHRLSRGVPRRINLLCDRAMLGAYASGVARVDRKTVDKAAAEVFGDAEPAPRRRVALAAGTAAVLMLAAGGGTYWTMGSRSETHAATAAAPAAVAASRTAALTPPAPTGASAPIERRAMSGDAAASAAEATTASAPEWLRSEAQALRRLAARWNVTIGADEDPCQQATRHGMRCFKISGGLGLIRRLDRPVVLTLYDDAGRASYAVLAAIEGDRLVLGTDDGGSRRLPLDSLTSSWRGEFSTFWRAPPGYRGGALPEGSSGPAVDWLAARLAAAQGRSAPAAPQTLDAELKGRVQAFQIAQGLRPDGLAGPATLMQLNRATGIDEPRLLASGS
ncbi:AAA family ATPase [Caldimonas sp. KR1-144]|uniref:AAA family ATPase n=1 Tax=Caldimonas sp. KR1-144 TaxID=3400911 RepID=UPI003BFB7001